MKTRGKAKFAAVAIGAVTILGGLAAAGAVTAARAISPGDESKAVIADAAGQLGIEPAALSDALKQALKNRIDAAAKAGRLTNEQATKLKDRIDNADGLPLFGGPRGFGHHFGPGHPGLFGALDAAAGYLGLTQAELREALVNSTLAEIAKNKGKSVDGLVQALVADARSRIDAAVADGRLTQEQAAELKSGLQARIERLVNGEFRDHGFGFHHQFRSGDGAPRAPPFFWGPRA